MEHILFIVKQTTEPTLFTVLYSGCLERTFIQEGLYQFSCQETSKVSVFNLLKLFPSRVHVDKETEIKS